MGAADRVLEYATPRPHVSEVREPWRWTVMFAALVSSAGSTMGLVWARNEFFSLLWLPGAVYGAGIAASLFYIGYRRNMIVLPPAGAVSYLLATFTVFRMGAPIAGLIGAAAFGIVVLAVIELPRKHLVPDLILLALVGALASGLSLAFVRPLLPLEFFALFVVWQTTFAAALMWILRRRSLGDPRNKFKLRTKRLAPSDCPLIQAMAASSLTDLYARSESGRVNAPRRPA